MSEFKISCPGCGQRIAVTHEYVGHQINCPVCQSAIVVSDPEASAAAAPSSIATPLAPGAPPPPTPPAKGRLGVSALSSPQTHAAAPPSAGIADVSAAAFKAHAFKKEKKSYAGLITGVVSVLVVGVAAYFLAPTAIAKYKEFRGTSTAENVETNLPPELTVELTVDQIWVNVAALYKGLPSLSATGKFVSKLDWTQANAAKARQGLETVSEDLNIKLLRPGNFRIDIAHTGASTNSTITGWDAGGGDFVQANNQRSQVAPEALIDFLNNRYVVGVGDIVRLFNDDAHGTLVTAAPDWSRTNDDTIGGQLCYVLEGTVNLQDVLVWVNRKTFLIAQTQVTLSGITNAANSDDAKIRTSLMAINGGKQVYTAQINQVKTMAKLKGTVIDTYQNIQTNATITVAELEPAKPVVAVAAAPPQGGPGGGPGMADPGNGGGPGGGGGGRGGGGRGRGR